MDTNRINRLSLEGDRERDTAMTGVCREVDGVRIYLDSELGDHIASMLKATLCSAEFWMTRKS